ncbi:Sterol-sensing domain and Acriflavin resistance protein family and Patched family-containing protein [Strongyloides ratti]|uniref:Sterol-sensing domain and Acriflavin resistance protein family and Patched family-containing protein n=1 Tax=Strongyloides ratti TaxID=34506 RepID=A0A090LRY3_STRRB|nr:Sterol-sensing domain and Acriflavin resistance protein family and Patched family-containing protein [Strongyloides ratti]CEF70972.1 Sterol-sensing domain and Acriflavin resistance protein family and Patched family-containing protein [Strongyloides ratti]
MKVPFFIKLLNSISYTSSNFLSTHPKKLIIFTIILTIICSIKIPLSNITNDVSDFTPNEARARYERIIYDQFFANKGQGKSVFIFITAKNNDKNMLSEEALHDTVEILDIVYSNFTVYDKLTNRYLNYTSFCKNFCIINEPIRHFYNGLKIKNKFNDTKSDGHLDLSFPITTVLGRQIHLDPNFFGANIEIKLKDMEKTSTYSMMNQLQLTKENDILSSVKNNLKSFNLVLLQFRAEIPYGVSPKNATKWELDIVNYFNDYYQSNSINAYVLTETFLTDEIVRSGLTLAPFLLIGFIIMTIFSSITMSIAAAYVNQYNHHKITLAFFACVCPFMACGTALGLMFWLGFRFGSILCVTPFLVLAIGVDDSYLMVNSWQRILKSYQLTSSNNLSSKSIFKDVIIDTVPSITITTLTNILAFGIGALTPTPEIQLFSIGNTLAIIVDYFYTWIFYGTILYLCGNNEIEQINNSNKDKSETVSKTVEKNNIKDKIKNLLGKFLDYYCNLLTNKIIASLIIGILILYWYISISATLNIKAELIPQKLFLETSNVVKILDLRNEYVVPFYAVVFVFVNNPGNMSDPKQILRLNNMVNDFEIVSNVIAKHYTKYWYRDYELFIKNIEESVKEMDDDYFLNGINELPQFLEWPEFSFWKGFLDYKIINKQVVVERFFFTTASHGASLKEWSYRSENLERWRGVADKYNDLNVTVYEDDAKFLDLIPTLKSQTLSSSICTLVCMFIVCLMFMGDPITVLVATFSITSTCIGVFGILTKWGEDLDPIVMSATIMSIGFSVDIPAHITYHYYQTQFISNSKLQSVKSRLQHCLLSIGFPVLEAGISTNICVMSLLFVNLHMATVFVKTMVLVVTIGLVHGLIIIPALFYLISIIPTYKKSPIEDCTNSNVEKNFVIA